LVAIATWLTGVKSVSVLYGRRVLIYGPIECVLVVAISLGGHVRADRAAGAGAVVDHDLLAHAGAHLLRDGACQQVGRAAGREGHDQADRLAGIGVGQCGRGGQAKPAAKADAEAAQPGFHTCLRCQAIGPDS
jgi:hypothetical protein